MRADWARGRQVHHQAMQWYRQWQVGTASVMLLHCCATASAGELLVIHLVRSHVALRYDDRAWRKRNTEHGRSARSPPISRYWLHRLARGALTRMHLSFQSGLAGLLLRGDFGRGDGGGRCRHGVVRAV